MTLPSQSGRGGAANGKSAISGDRAPRPPGRAVAIGLLVLVLVVSAWLIASQLVGPVPKGPPAATSTDDPLGSKPLISNISPDGGQAAPDAAGSPGAESSTPDTAAAPAGTETTGDIAGAPDAPAPAPVPSGPEAEAAALIDAGRQRMDEGRPLEAREAFSRALRHPGTSEADRRMLREVLGEINAELIFSPRVTPGDPLTESYAVQPGDSLVRIAQKQGLSTDWRLIQRVNGITDPNRIRVGQRLKLVAGPFHAVVDKSDYRMDLYVGDPDSPDDWVFVRSLRVGLGAEDGTPVGSFVVKGGSKLIDPHWTNPRTGERFAASDPKNPIGERWIGLEGLGESARYVGYGIHGTIEPESIGQSRSMGCVRLSAPDAELVYELLAERVSLVRIEP